MYGEIGSKSNTMIFSEKPGDINALMAQAALVMNSTLKNDNKNAQPNSSQTH